VLVVIPYPIITVMYIALGTLIPFSLVFVCFGLRAKSKRKSKKKKEKKTKE
jgi:hypothetical protein